MDMSPGDTAVMRLRLTKRGRQLVRTSDKTRIRGVAEFRDSAGTSVTGSAAITLRLRRR